MRIGIEGHTPIAENEILFSILKTKCAGNCDSNNPCQEDCHCCDGQCQEPPCCSGSCDGGNPCKTGCYCCDGQCQSESCCSGSCDGSNPCPAGCNCCYGQCQAAPCCWGACVYSGINFGCYDFSVSPPIGPVDCPVCSDPCSRGGSVSPGSEIFECFPTMSKEACDAADGVWYGPGSYTSVCYWNECNEIAYVRSKCPEGVENPQADPKYIPGC